MSDVNPGFRFKQFYVRHDRCAMKVGTDGVLLGAWTPISQEPKDHPYMVLDVGTGSGLIARMLMQRCPKAEIEGIDIDEAAVEQARENGVKAHCAAFQKWQGTYDLIVSNPPFFQNSLKNPDKGRQLARHTDTLPYAELIHHSARLLKANGRLSLILPADTETEVRRLAENEGLFPIRITHVFSKEGKPPRRVLLLFEMPECRNPDTPIQEDILILEDGKGGRSAQYSELTKDFYL